MISGIVGPAPDGWPRNFILITARHQSWMTAPVCGSPLLQATPASPTDAVMSMCAKVEIVFGPVRFSTGAISFLLLKSDLSLDFVSLATLPHP